MKKVLFCAMALLCAISVSAQTKEEFQASKARAEKLEKLAQPKSCKIAEVDALTTAAGTIAAESVQITPLLQGMYFRSIGETEEGITDVTVKKPTVEELMELSGRIALQAVAVKTAAELVPAAGSALKSIKNPMQLKAPTQAVNYGKDVLAIAGEESVFQAKAIAEMIKTAQEGDNL